MQLALDSLRVDDLVRSWLLEDCTSGFDYAACVAGDSHETAVLLYKDTAGDGDAVLAGVRFVEAVFAAVNCTCRWSDGMTDGASLRCGQEICRLDGRACDLLRGERVALNCLARCSGASTAARRLLRLAASVDGWQGRVAGTRKTTPGFRLVEKYALMVAGADPHRHDLSSMVMLKDNHIWSAGDVTKAVTLSRRLAGFSMRIDVECRSAAEARAAAAAGADIVMLDNFHPSAVRDVAAKIKSEFPSVLIEVSGGIDDSNLLDYVGPNVDVVSVGVLTHGYRSLDFSLKLVKDGHDPYNPLVK